MAANRGDERDWSELPLDALSSVFVKLGAVEVLMGAGLVCRSWLSAATVAPDVWRRVHMARHPLVDEMDEHLLRAMAKAAVDRSDGRLEEFAGKRFVTDELLEYIAERSPSSLKGLALVSCNQVTDKGFIHLVTRSPLLQDLVLLSCPKIDGAAYEAAGAACGARLVLHKGWYDEPGGAAAIASTMRELRDLSLAGSDITTGELAAVLDSCPRLERLRVRQCHNVAVDDGLRAKCGRIRDLTLPTVQDELQRYYCDDDIDEFRATDCSRDFDDWRSD